MQSAQWIRVGFILLGLYYLVGLIRKRWRGERNSDPKLARLEAWQLGGFLTGLCAFGVMGLSVVLSAPGIVVLAFAFAGVAGMIVYAIAYVMAWRP